jgi:copper transport protein
MNTQTRELISLFYHSVCRLPKVRQMKLKQAKKLPTMNYFIMIAILIIIITFSLMLCSLPSIRVHAQVGPEAIQVESVTSTYDALLKAPMIISQIAIVGGVFNHIFLQRVLRSRTQPNYKNNKPMDSSLQSLRRLFILIVACSLTILVTASSLIYLQAISLSSELDLDVTTTFTILTSTPVGPVWILRIVTSSIIVASSILYYILEKKKTKRITAEEDHYTYNNKQRKINLSLSKVLLYIIISSGAISILSNSVVSHSAALSFLPSLAISMDWLHFMAVSIWVGGLFYISAILLVTIRSTINATEPINEAYETRKARNTYFLAVLLPYFSLIATISLGIIGVTGLYMAWIHLHTAGALFDTTYGNVLIIKLSVILPMVILGAYHQLRLHDSLVLFARIGKGGEKSNDKRNSAANTAGGGGRSNSLRADPFAKFSKTINIESFIGIGVLFISSFLTISSPPSTSMAENSDLNGSSTSENDMPSFDSFAVLVIILSAAVLTGSIFYFVKSKREIKKTIDYLHP